jgi:hypothetical protein
MTRLLVMLRSNALVEALDANACSRYNLESESFAFKLSGSTGVISTGRARHPMRFHRMTIPEFDASTSSPRHGVSVAEGNPSTASLLPDSATPSLSEFHASIADATDEQHQNMAGLVQRDDFNAEVVVRFLRDNGIDASVDESTGAFRYTAADPGHASNVRFACVCLRASISYALEAAFWCIKGKR